MRFFFIFIVWIFTAVFVQAQTDTIFNQTDAQNLKQGWWKKSYPNGKLMYKGFFKDNKPVGQMKRYYETGSLKAILQYDNRGVYAHARFLYEDGQIAAMGVYYNLVKDSTWSYYSYYDHAITTREIYTRGVRNGVLLNYFNNGNLSEKINWVNDKKDGPWEQYFSNNTLKLKGSFQAGQLEGDFIVNYENGNPYLKGSYLNGLREGRWSFYREDGSTDMELVYHQGKTPDEDKLDAKQKELFRTIEENKGKFQEPDETNFLTPPGR
jgi:antitoxin component YwqK of YwqJK toxin-antitoxin module